MSRPGTPEIDQNEIQIANYVPIVGTWEIEDGRATFRRYEDESFKVGVALSDVTAINGTFRATVEMSKATGSCARILFGFNAKDGVGFSIGVGGHHQAFVLSQYFMNRRARLVRGVGKEENLRANRPYRLEVTLRGSNVKLIVDGVRVLDHNLPHPLGGDQFGVYAYGDGSVTFRGVTALLGKPRAFVVMQFSEPYDSLWREVIEPVTRKVGFEAYRADDVYGPGVILQDIVRGISSSQAIIAEVTPHNPNVYYELGYAHALGTPTILLAERPKDGKTALPFDISGFRCIVYDDAIRGKGQVEVALERHLQNILESREDGSESEM